ncbi:MAG: hypothetical protein JO036_22070 [Candidatus Eremiobacteraeota bacterium]|nr:hypothetical protein [Candidatus Eremiobacteraeota bacterium]
MTTFSRSSAAAFSDAAALSARFAIPVSPGLVFFSAVARTVESADPLITADILEAAISEYARDADFPERLAHDFMRQLAERAYSIASDDSSEEITLAHLILVSAALAMESLEKSLRAVDCSLSGIVRRVAGWSPEFLLSLQPPPPSAENVKSFSVTARQLESGHSPAAGDKDLYE